MSMFNQLLRDRVSIVKADGTRTDDLPANVTSTSISIHRSEPLIEPGDLVIRKASNGAEETFRVIDPNFREAFHGIPARYEMKVQKLGIAEARNAVKSVTYNVTGSNARINHHSEDNSTNTVVRNPDTTRGQTGGSIGALAGPARGPISLGTLGGHQVELAQRVSRLEAVTLIGVERQQPLTKLKIFISHSSVDVSSAEALVEFIRGALNIGAKEIRCTSVPGYKLSAGTDANEQLRAEAIECEAFIALLSPTSMKSTYVMFELGARWGSKQYMAPIMIGAVTGADLKPPLSTIHAVSGSSEVDMHQLVSDLANQLGLEVEQPASYLKALQKFAHSAVAGAQNGRSDE